MLLAAQLASGSELGRVTAEYYGIIVEAASRADGLFPLDAPQTEARWKEPEVNTFVCEVWDGPGDWDGL